MIACDCYYPHMPVDLTDVPSAKASTRHAPSRASARSALRSAELYCSAETHGLSPDRLEKGISNCLLEKCDMIKCAQIRWLSKGGVKGVNVVLDMFVRLV